MAHFSQLGIHKNVSLCVRVHACVHRVLPAGSPPLLPPPANLAPCIRTPDYHRHGFFFLNSKIYRLIITVNKRKSTKSTYPPPLRMQSDVRLRC